MRRVTNEALIKRNARIGKFSGLAGLAVLVGGLIYSWRVPEQPSVPFLTLLVGFLLSNIGIYFANRWVKPPRPDQALDAALKGLDDRHVLYHYRLGASHALVGPAGVFAFVTKPQPGEVRFTGGRWQHRGGNVLLKFLGQEGLGNPTHEAASEAKALERRLGQWLPGETVPEVTPIVVFTNDSVTVDADEPPFPVVHAKKLKAYLRSLPKRPSLSASQLAALDEKIGAAPSRVSADADG